MNSEEYQAKREQIKKQMNITCLPTVYHLLADQMQHEQYALQQEENLSAETQLLGLLKASENRRKKSAKKIIVLGLLT